MSAPADTDGVRTPSAADPVVAALLQRCTFPPAGTAVTCAVSGGADSSALAALAVAGGLDVTVVHVDHGLRVGSASEAAVVESLALGWRAAFRSMAAHVEPGGDLEARARVARMGVLPDDTLFGHTAEDQAETILLRLLRGTGPSGLAAMRARGHPLLRVRCAETVALCDHLGVVPFEDPTNTDPRYRRNRVRHEVLPLLADVAERDVVPLLCRLAELSADQADLIGELTATVDVSDGRSLAELPATVASEAIRMWWMQQTDSNYPPDAKAIARIMDVADGGSIACDVMDGWRVRRSRGRLSLERA